MKVQWLGEPSGPDEITMSGFTFERKGEPVDVPDNHPHAKKFEQNHYFKVQKALPPVEAGEPEKDPAPRAPRAPKPAAKGKPGPKAKAPKDEPVAEETAVEPETA